MLFFKTEYTGAVAEIARGEGTTTKMMREVFGDAYAACLDWWHKKIRPKHFERTAISRYGYAPRNVGYERRKVRELGHRRPLVYSGESEQATRQNWIKVSGRSASLHMNAGNLGWNPGGRNMRAELTATNAEDEAEMAREFERTIGERMRSWHGRFTQKVA